MTHLAACDVAARLRISEDSAYRLMRRMPHVRIGRLIRVAPADLDRYTECDSTAGFSIQHTTSKGGQNMNVSTCRVHAVYTNARLAKCAPLDSDGAFAALELAELDGTWGRS